MVQIDIYFGSLFTLLGHFGTGKLYYSTILLKHPVDVLGSRIIHLADFMIDSGRRRECRSGFGRKVGAWAGWTDLPGRACVCDVRRSAPIGVVCGAVRHLKGRGGDKRGGGAAAGADEG